MNAEDWRSQHAQTCVAAAWQDFAAHAIACEHGCYHTAAGAECVRAAWLKMLTMAIAELGEANRGQGGSAPATTVTLS